MLYDLTYNDIIFCMAGESFQNATGFSIFVDNSPRPVVKYIRIVITVYRVLPSGLIFGGVHSGTEGKDFL